MLVAQNDFQETAHEQLLCCCTQGTFITSACQEAGKGSPKGAELCSHLAHDCMSKVKDLASPLKAGNASSRAVTPDQAAWESSVGAGLGRLGITGLGPLNRRVHSVEVMA